ncbi:MAG: thiol reductant ABC exporter subunit CydC [Rhodoluna sp.]
MTANLKKLLALGLPTGNDFKLGLLVAAFQAISALALMGFSAWLISRASEMPPVMYLNMAIVGVRGFALGRAAFRYAERLLLHNSAFRLMSELRPRVFSKLIPLAPAGLGANRADTVTRLVTDVDEVQNLSLRILSPVVQAVMVSAATVSFFWLTVPAAGMWVLGCILAAVMLALPLANWLASVANANVAAERSGLNQRTMDLIENLDVLDSFGWLSEYREAIVDYQNRLTHTSRRQALAAGVGQSLFLFCATLATAGAAYFAGLQVSHGTSQQGLLPGLLPSSLPGVMLAVFALVPIALFDTLTSLQPVVGVWQRYRSSAARVLETLESNPDSLLAEVGGGDIPTTVTQLRLSNLSAKYPGQARMTVSGISLTINVGQNVLVTGASGRGKGTIANVMLGFLNPVAGEYLIDGIPSSQIAPDSLRRIIGYQEQSPTIFTGTLKANLLLAKPDATDEELWQVLKRVKLASTFEKREGLETQLGERGHAISGGEAQRVALARMILADFRVLIFDEPTANVDPQTAIELARDLLNIAKADTSRASIFISHDSIFTSEEFAKLVDSTLNI